MKQYKEKITQLLTDIPQTRENDNLLIAHYIKDVLGLQNTFDIAIYTKSNIYESIRRTRAKIQEENPLLRPCEQTQIARLNKEQEIKEQMRGL